MNVLLVEDEGAIRYLCDTVLRKNGYQTTAATTIQAARKALETAAFDLLIIDLNLPDGDGLQLVHAESLAGATPILVMTGRNTPEQRFEGFEAGATDYLIKPFHPGELLHRVQGLLSGQRRAPAAEGAEEADALPPFGPWVLDPSTSNLIMDSGTAVELTPGEFDLLKRLFAAQGHVVSRDSLLEAVTRGESEGHPRTVDVLISRLRKKLEPDPANPRHIITVPRQGYRLEATK
ncbi:response regulator transcription factor [Marinobacterium arenosum]|uniref:response regulator transcription factor n=1 Tax=Marinobacterium arenosum TaxID=2862496 RepID=UPI001C93F3CB|nr:response regulator transcription factor [Marinobacterium arenosum]MBY4677653.1 response regulator transcription factor [Marinobacterium arenosum]